ncbi:MAG: hypothetical protein V7603_332 [Micromonosporaceae bacterium]
MSTPSRPPSSRDERRGEPPRMQPTRPATLVVAGLAAAALSWLIIGNVYGNIPKLPWLPPITIFALAVGEGVLARTTKARIDHKPGTPRPDPLAVARYVVLAKASALAGAIFSGFYAGVLIWLLVEGFGAAAQNDVPAAAGGLVAAVALVAGALLLERACRVPKRPEDDEPPE